MTDERLRELERRWRQTGSLDDEIEYLRAGVKAGRDAFEIYSTVLALSGWRQSDEPWTAQAKGERMRTLFEHVSPVAKAVIRSCYEGDVEEIPEDELEITALCAHYARQLCGAGGENRENTLRRNAITPPVLTVRLGNDIRNPLSAQGTLVRILDVIGSPHPTMGTVMHFDYLCLFGSKYQVEAHQPTTPSGLPRSYTFYTHKLDEEGIVKGRIEHAVLRIEQRG